MTEFRAPPPPPELDLENDANLEPVKLEDLADIKHVDPKILGLGAVLLIGGLLLGALFFGGSDSAAEQPTIQGLTNIVKNPDIKEHLQYCGLVSETSPCVLYIMNHTRGDKVAETFFEEAAKLTRRNKYTIEIENTGYAKMRIRPSFFAEIKIPALR